MTGLKEQSTGGVGRGSWFVVYVEPSREQLSATLLTESGYEIFLPKYRKWIAVRDRRRRIELPLFPRYVFCRLTTAVTARIIGTPGVVKLIGFSNGNGIIGDAEIQMLRRLKEAGASPFKGIAVGTRVRVKGGALDGVEGLLVSQSGDHSLVISIDAIQRSLSLRLDGYEVEPI